MSKLETRLTNSCRSFESRCPDNLRCIAGTAGWDNRHRHRLAADTAGMGPPCSELHTIVHLVVELPRQVCPKNINDIMSIQLL